MPSSTSAVSIIVIGRDESSALKYLVPRMASMRGVREVIFCDGGSQDDSVALARSLGAQVLSASGGRGAQLRAGAEAASGDILWFLHADARPHQSSALAILRACRAHQGQPQVLGGNFRLRFASRLRWARVFEIIARLQRVVGVYYGDSGIWVRRDVYEALGGFRDWPLFEDLDFARRLQVLAGSRRARTVCLRPALLASSRRFEKDPWRVLKLWISMQWRFQRGEDPRDLAREYHGSK